MTLSFVLSGSPRMRSTKSSSSSRIKRTLPSDMASHAISTTCGWSTTPRRILAELPLRAPACPYFDLLEAMMLYVRMRLLSPI